MTDAQTHLVEGSLVALTLEEIVDVLPESRELSCGDRLPDLRTFSCDPVLAQVVQEEDTCPPKERSDRDVSEGILPYREALGREERLEVLEGCVQVLRRVALPDEVGHVGGHQLARDAFNEEAGLCTLHGVFGEDARLGEEVADELDKNEGLGEFD